MDFEYPREINFFTTYRCNSRCQNCFIWQGHEKPPHKKELGAGPLSRLFEDPIFVKCPNIGLAGGEPTISSFFWKLLEMLPHDKQLNITTNALSSKKLVDFLGKVEPGKKYLIQVSLDGVGEVNDRVRGVKGAYSKTIALLEKLQELNVDRLVSFTINRLNYHQLVDCYTLANKYGAQFMTRMAHIGGAYLNKENRRFFEFDKNDLDALERALDRIISLELSNPSHVPARLVFMKKIPDYYRGIQKDLPCMAMKSAMVVDLYGDVFPNCPSMMNKTVGNLHEQTLSDIWWGKKAHEMRAKISKLKCGGCWNDCQVITNIDRDQNFTEKEYVKIKVAFLKTLAAPDFIDFSKGGSPLLLRGWYNLGRNSSQSGCCWTQQEFSILLPEGVSSLEIFAMLPSPSSYSAKPGNMDVIIGREKIASIALAESEWKKYSIWLAKPMSDLTPCKFKLNRYYCPKEEGESEDERKLGLAVNQISFGKEQ